MSTANIVPEYLGNALDKWKEEMKVNGPPREIRPYPIKNGSTELVVDNDNDAEASVADSATKRLVLIKITVPVKIKDPPTNPQTLGPKLSNKYPIGNAEIFVSTAQTVKIKLSLISCSAHFGDTTPAFFPVCAEYKLTKLLTWYNKAVLLVWLLSFPMLVS